MIMTRTPLNLYKKTYQIAYIKRRQRSCEAPPTSCRHSNRHLGACCRTFFIAIPERHQTIRYLYTYSIDLERSWLFLAIPNIRDKSSE